RGIGNSLAAKNSITPLRLYVFLYKQLAHLVGYLRPPHGALRLDRAVQARGHLDGEALHRFRAIGRSAAFDPRTRGRLGGRFGSNRNLLAHCANSISSAVPASISAAAGPSW